MKINNNKIKSLFLLSLIGSGLGKESNQTEIASDEINLNSLPQIATNLTKRGNETDPTLIFAGYPISLTIDGLSGRFIKHCTASFMVVNTNSSNCNFMDYGGYLTTTLCWELKHWRQFHAIATQEVMSWDGFERLGTFPQALGAMNLYPGSYKNIDYTYISISDGGVWPNVKLIPYVAGDEDLYPVMGLGSVTIGSKVCAYGAGSGYMCGNLTEINAKLVIPNSWWNSSTDIFGDLTLEGLSKVDLGANGFYSEEDLGGPVYVESKIGDQTTAQALGHITHFDNVDPNHKLLYYTPLDKALGRMFDNSQCSFTLMTYKETNAQEYDQLLAQVEIPPKK